MATLGKTLPRTAVLPVRSLIRKEGALKLRGEVLLALDTLRKNPLRSALTILGIVIGITTVITVSAVINGLNENVLRGIRELGSDTIIAYRFPWASLSRPPSEWFNRKELQAEWADDIAKLPHVAAASPSMRIFMPQFGSGTVDVRRGSYRARLVFPSPGRWTLAARAGGAASKLGSVSVRAPGTRLAFVWPTAVVKPCSSRYHSTRTAAAR